VIRSIETIRHSLAALGRTVLRAGCTRQACALATAGALLLGSGVIGSLTVRADDAGFTAAGRFDLDGGVSPEQTGIVPHPNAQVPLNTTFLDEYGTPVQLSTYITGKRPVILVPVYYSCPKLCNLTLNGLFSALSKPAMDLSLRSDYDVIALSFDDRDTPAVALAKKENYLKALHLDDADAHIHFLSGHEGQIRQVTSAIGFGYLWNNTDQQFAHQTGIFVLTPDGKVSSTIGGINFDSLQLRDSLLNAGQGKVGSAIFRAALCCGLISFDGDNGKYRKNSVRIMQVGAFGTMLALGSVVSLLFWRERGRGHGLPIQSAEKNTTVDLKAPGSAGGRST
jgi:protein SCO1/2